MISFNFKTVLESKKTRKRYSNILKKRVDYLQQHRSNYQNQIDRNNKMIEMIGGVKENTPVHVHCYKNDDKIVKLLNKNKIPVLELIQYLNKKCNKDVILTPKSIINQNMSSFLKIINQGGGHIPEDYILPFTKLYNQKILNHMSILIYKEGYQNLRNYLNSKKRPKKEIQLIIKAIEKEMRLIRKEVPGFRHNSFDVDHVYLKKRSNNGFDIKIAIGYNSSLNNVGKNNDLNNLKKSIETI